ncbi:hypothetical protein MRX96_029176 [Rhipicephalus microplus]
MREKRVRSAGIDMLGMRAAARLRNSGGDRVAGSCPLRAGSSITRASECRALAGVTGRRIDWRPPPEEWTA